MRRGGGHSVQDLAAGGLDVVTCSVPEARAMIDAGKVRSLAIMAPQREPNPWRYAGVGLELAGVVVGLAWLGYALDNWRGTAPWGVIIGSTLGIVGGLYNLIRQVIADQQRDEKKGP